GEPPFKGKDLTTIMTRAASEPLPSVRRGHPEIPPALDRVVQRGLERDRSRRWSDLPKLRTALSRFLPMRLSSGDLGPRFCAYLIDMVLVLFLWWLYSLPLLSWAGEIESWGKMTPWMRNGFSPNFLLIPYLLVMSVPALLYFGLLEGLAGYTLGKWLF